MDPPSNRGFATDSASNLASAPCRTSLRRSDRLLRFQCVRAVGRLPVVPEVEAIFVGGPSEQQAGVTVEPDEAGNWPPVLLLGDPELPRPLYRFARRTPRPQDRPTYEFVDDIPPDI